MNSVRTKILLVVIAIVIAYPGSYLICRSMWVERWDQDGHDYVIFPTSTILYYLYRPLTYVDARFTGMRFHIGPHR
jgi:hypothetical protein